MTTEIAEPAVLKPAKSGLTTALGGASSAMKDTIRALAEMLMKRAQAGGGLVGISTGFTDLDVILSGLVDGDLTILAARTSMGKTALALAIAGNVALRSRKPVLIASLEMSAVQLAMRLVAGLARVDLKRLRTGQLNEMEWASVYNALITLSQAPIRIENAAARTPRGLRDVAIGMREDEAPALIVVDYLQLMSVDDRRDSREQEVATISRSMKELAMELQVPVLALSQLNRSLEQRSDKRPMLSDLRESGAIEQDADNVLFIYRDDVYNRESTQAGLAEIIVAKQRMGPVGTIMLGFEGRYTAFENIAA